MYICQILILFSLNIVYMQLFLKKKTFICLYVLKQYIVLGFSVFAVPIISTPECYHKYIKYGSAYWSILKHIEAPHPTPTCSQFSYRPFDIEIELNCTTGNCIIERRYCIALYWIFNPCHLFNPLIHLISKWRQVKRSGTSLSFLQTTFTVHLLH